jgi:hypothetical protein
VADHYLRLRTIIVSTRAALIHHDVDEAVVKARGVELLDALTAQVRMNGADPTVMAMIVAARAEMEADSGLTRADTPRSAVRGP